MCFQASLSFLALHGHHSTRVLVHVREVDGLGSVGTHGCQSDFVLCPLCFRVLSVTWLIVDPPPRTVAQVDGGSCAASVHGGLGVAGPPAPPAMSLHKSSNDACFGVPACTCMHGWHSLMGACLPLGAEVGTVVVTVVTVVG